MINMNQTIVWNGDCYAATEAVVAGHKVLLQGHTPGSLISLLDDGAWCSAGRISLFIPEACINPKPLHALPESNLKHFSKMKGFWSTPVVGSRQTSPPQQLGNVISEVADMCAASASKKSKISNDPIADYHRMQQSSDAPVWFLRALQGSSFKDDL